MIIIMVKLHDDECGNNLELKSCINGACNTYDNVTSSYQFQINNYFDQKSVKKLIIVRRLLQVSQNCPTLRPLSSNLRYANADMKNLFWLKGGDKTIAVECSIMLRQQNGRRFLGMLGNCFKMLVFLWFPSPLSRKQSNFFFVKEKLKHTCQEQKAEMEKEVSFNSQQF